MLKIAFPKSPAKVFLFAAIIVFIAVLFMTFPPSFQKKQETVDLESIFGDKTYKKFSEYSQEAGLKEAYELLKQRFPKNEPRAHDFAHVVGIKSYEINKKNGLSVCDTAYNYGCYHGFIEAYISDMGNVALPKIENSCLSLGSVHSPSCLHGIGHGVLASRSYKLNVALTDCDQLLQNSRSYCWDGVFMERITASMQDPNDRQPQTEDTLDEPCDSLSYAYRKNCWRNQVSAWFNYYGENPKSVGSRCALIEKEFQNTCFENIGFHNVMTTGEDFQKLVSSCKIISSGSDNCLMGELQELLFEGKNPALSQSLCGQVNASFQRECQEIFNLHYSQYQQRFGDRP